MSIFREHQVSSLSSRRREALQDGGRWAVQVASEVAHTLEGGAWRSMADASTLAAQGSQLHRPGRCTQSASWKQAAEGEAFFGRGLARGGGRRLPEGASPGREAAPPCVAPGAVSGPLLRRSGARGARPHIRHSPSTGGRRKPRTPRGATATPSSIVPPGGIWGRSNRPRTARPWRPSWRACGCVGAGEPAEDPAPLLQRFQREEAVGLGRFREGPAIHSMLRSHPTMLAETFPYPKVRRAQLSAKDDLKEEVRTWLIRAEFKVSEVPAMDNKVPWVLSADLTPFPVLIYPDLRQGKLIFSVQLRLDRSAEAAWGVWSLLSVCGLVQIFACTYSTLALISRSKGR